MAKQSLEWHQNCLRNFTKSMEGLKQQRDRLSREVERMEEEIELRRAQIRRAMALGKDSYDADKFCVKKGCRPY